MAIECILKKIKKNPLKSYTMIEILLIVKIHVVHIFKVFKNEIQFMNVSSTK